MRPAVIRASFGDIVIFIRHIGTRGSPRSALPLGLSKNFGSEFPNFMRLLPCLSPSQNFFSPNLSPKLSLYPLIKNAWLLPFKYQKIDISLKFLLDWTLLLQIAASTTIIFSNFAVKQQKSIMATLNRIRVVLAERDLNNKWLADKLGKFHNSDLRRHFFERKWQHLGR